MMPFHGQQFIHNQLGRPFPGAPQGSGATGGMPPFMQQLMEMMGQGGMVNSGGPFGQPDPSVQPGWQWNNGQQGGQQGAPFANTWGQPGTNVGDPGFDDTPFGQQGGDPRTRFFSRMMRQRGGGGLQRAPGVRGFVDPAIGEEQAEQGRRLVAGSNADYWREQRRRRQQAARPGLEAGWAAQQERFQAMTPAEQWRARG